LQTSTDEVVDLKKENANLKQAVAELYLRNDWLKKSLTGQDVMLDMNTKLQLDMGLFLSCFCSANKIKSLSTGPMEDFMAVAIALARKDDEALGEITESLLLSECFKTISAMDTLIYEQELNWNESIKVINTQQSSYDDEVLLALNDL